MLKRYWRPETGIFLGLWLGLMVAGRSGLFHDPGTFWHTVVGERLLSSRRLIYTDSFSFTFAGRPWIPHQWLGECLMALVHRLDGLDSLLLASVTVLAALYTWAAHRMIRSGLHWSLAAVLVGVTVAASSSHFHVRPHLGTIVFMGCTIAFLCDFEAGRLSLGRMFWLVPIYAVWSNIHGGMLGGLGTMGLALVGWWGAGIMGQKSPVERPGQALSLMALIAACGLTAFLNPYGWRLPWTWLSIMDSPLLPQIIQEHAPLNAAKPAGWMVLVLAAVYVIVLAGVLPRRPRVTWLLPLAWLYLACTRVRHAPLFSITAAFALADMLPHTYWAAWLERNGSDWFQSPGEVDDGRWWRWDWKPALVPIGVVLTALVLQIGRVPVPLVGHGWARLDAADWPVALLPELERCERSRPEGTAIFNEYAYGGFLIYYTPGFRVFVDDRCELYGDQWLRDYVLAEGHGAARQVHEWEEKYRKPDHEGAFDFALTRSGSAFDRYFAAEPGWLAVKRTPTAGLYQRRS
ncbi:MAG TPA: hypothetical protein VG013_29905 [Gemmataceae bacterium]|nr:hypothetical protein [Gemmataceae bacterium]